ncbi:hypothetical protein UXO51_08410 [Enterobacter hormaechei]
MIVQDNHLAGTGFIPVMMDLSIEDCGDSRYVVKEKQLHVTKNQQRLVIVLYNHLLSIIKSKHINDNQTVPLNRHTPR